MTRLIEQFDSVVLLFGTDWEARITADWDREYGWQVIGCELGGVCTDADMVRFARAAEVNLATLSADELDNLHAHVIRIDQENSP
jgi:hypothetical protein